MRAFKRVLLFYFVLSLLSCNSYSGVEVGKDHETTIRVRSHRNDRGVSVINEQYLFRSICPLINDEVKNLSIGWVPEIFERCEGLVPYVISKNKAEDFFYVIKSGDTLKYQLLEFEQ